MNVKAPTSRFAYDAVPYDTEANPEAHPRSMATLARLFRGGEPAAPSTARVLEIGCGDGEHMLAAASYLPRARFVGFDLAADAIARGAETARALGMENVELLHRDVCEVRRRGVREAGTSGENGTGALFDYVIAHGVYSWVPEVVRRDVLAVMRSALAPSGVGFVSVNASPGWELRRSLRILMREAAAAAEEPAEKVRLALQLVDDLGAAGGDGFAGVLARAAREYHEHVQHATPPDAAFSRYVFHDLLAECNDPFSIEQLEARLHAEGLAIICETPLRAARGRADFPGLAAAMAASGSPFLQVLVRRDDAPSGNTTPSLEAIRSMHLWADLAPAPGGTYRTTTGAALRASGDLGLAKAARSAPGFVPVKELATDDDMLAKLERDLFSSMCDGVLSIATEPANIAQASAAPRVSPHVRLRAREAAERGAAHAVLTSALHRSFRVPLVELEVVRELDGRHDVAQIAASTGRSIAEVETVIDRFSRHGFFVATRESET